jgi:hypothetical protein
MNYAEIEELNLSQSQRTSTARRAATFAIGGGRGGKDPAQGKRRRDGRGPDTAPGYRVDGLIAVRHPPAWMAA